VWNLLKVQQKDTKFDVDSVMLEELSSSGITGGSSIFFLINF